MSKLPLALLLASVACVDNTPAGTTDTDVTALELENGGFDMTDEAPMFGQEAAFRAASIEPTAAFTDSMAADPTIVALDAQGDVARHRVLIAWGRMPPDPNATTARDWSGSLTLSRGALVVGRTIGFEEPNDHLLPRASVDTVSFVSTTKPYADGLILRVLDPTPGAGPLHLVYTSADAAHTLDLDLSQLANGAISIDAGGGNRVIALALRDRDDCDHGFLRGRWLAVQSNFGVYRGVVANADGDPIGHLRGIYGVRQNGDHVMFGKLIDLQGHFRGILAGTYEAGHWRARWLVASGDHGVAGGLYFDAPNLPGGFFAGRWAETSCAQ